MVQLLLQALRTDPQFEVYHVDVRLSAGTGDIGSMRTGKVPLLVWHCLQAIWCRLRHGVTTFYYVPASPTRAPLYRDWLVMFLCRPFFPRRIFHWHAAGLGEWLQRRAHRWERWISKRLLDGPALSVVLRDFNRQDAAAVRSRRVEVIPNGTPDPCPDFERVVLPRRLERLMDRQRTATGKLTVFRVLHVGLCVREKGIFDTLEAIDRANRKNSGTRFKLRVAGTFWIDAQRQEFESRCAALKFPDGEPQVEILGFVSEAQKNELFETSDCLSFPTYYSAENAPSVLVESMAFGLPVITTDWRMMSELLPAGYPGVVQVQSPEQIAAKLVDAIHWKPFTTLREHYLRHFTTGEFWPKMKSALLSV